MTDLETRLRADADLTPHVPDFTAALAVATRSRRRSPNGWAAAAAVVVVASSAGLAMVAHGSGHHPSPAGSTGDSSSHLSIAGAVLAAAPEKNLLMLVIRRPAGDCDAPEVTVHESATDVSVRLVSRSPGSDVTARVVPAPSGSAVGTPVPVGGSCSSGDPYTNVYLGLNNALNSRPLVDESTGAQISVFTAPVPEAGQLPPGYSGPVPDGIYAMPGGIHAFRPGLFGPMSLVRYYQDAVGDRLSVAAAPSADVIPGATVVDETTVDGHDATVTETADTRCVTWAPTPDSGRQVCSDIDQPNRSNSAGLLDEAELLAVARSLH